MHPNTKQKLETIYCVSKTDAAMKRDALIILLCLGPEKYDSSGSFKKSLTVHGSKIFKEHLITKV